MSEPSYTRQFVLSQAPAKVFSAVNDVGAWWSPDIEGPTDRQGGTFVYRHRDLHRSTQRVSELSPLRVVWEVLSSHLSFLSLNAAAWDGTRVVFELEPRGEGTLLR